MLNHFFNKINCAIIHKKNKLKINFIKKKIEKNLKKTMFIKSISRKKIELNFTKKKSINMYILKIFKKKNNVKN